MTNNKKMTKRDYFNVLLSFDNVKSNSELKEFIEHELELLAKKNSSEKKPTPTQVANEGLKKAILEGMAENRLYTITELIKEIPECAELTNQRVSAIIRQMVPEQVQRIEDKKKAYFKKV